MAWSSSLAKNCKLQGQRVRGERGGLPDHVSWHAHRCTLISNMAYGNEKCGLKGVGKFWEG